MLSDVGRKLAVIKVDPIWSCLASSAQEDLMKTASEVMGLHRRRIGANSVFAQDRHLSPAAPGLIPVARSLSFPGTGSVIAESSGRRPKMKILVAEDDAVTRKLLAATLERLGWEVTTASDGSAAWHTLEALGGKLAPEVVVLDWMMPGMDGIEICRKLRSTPGFEFIYIILLTSRSEKEDLAMGLMAGANDYIAKPFHPIELESRVRVGERMVKLQRSLAGRVTELEEALAHVQRLQGLLPICSYCKKVRNEANYWEQVDSYLSAHSDLDFTHGICPQCSEKLMKELDESPV
jgi:phosphoserine phosphatase RsbU/P